MVEIIRTVKAGDIAGHYILQDHNGSNFLLSRQGEQRFLRPIR